MNVVLKPINGLGDKIINMIGACVYCYYKQYNLKISFNDDILYYSFGSHNNYDLSLFKFDEIDVYPNYNSLPDEIIQLSEFHNPDTIVSITPFCIYEKLNKEGVHVSFNEVSQKFLEFYKKIRPSDIISSYIPFGIENAYGIHLRKTDKIKQNPDIRHEMSPDENNILTDELFLFMKNIIETEDRPCFYVSSEDNNHKNDFVAKIQEIATEKNKLADFLSICDNIPGEIASIPNFHSILDLFSLSKCKTIIQGIKYSAFSVVAAIIGNENIINFSKVLESDYLCIIYLWNSVININGNRHYDENEYSTLINHYKSRGVFYGEVYIS